ncbi:transglycosylase SLT domain-containing protein [Coprothermobacteraceae bacterium]|nr:transglycosylase SLT domain-containing protein [Coprothermobacteraceae bacterium]
MRKLVSILLILMLIPLTQVAGQQPQKALSVLPVSEDRLYIRASGPTTYTLIYQDGRFSVGFSLKWSGEMGNRLLSVSGFPWLTVSSSYPLTVERVSPTEYFVTAKQPYNSAYPTPDVDLVTGSTTTSATPPPTYTPTAITGTGIYEPSVLQAAIQFRLSKINRQVDTATVLQIAAAVSRWANFFKLDPFLILGLIEMESGFNPYAVSTASALGLMQVLESNFAYYANQLGVVNDPFNVDSNVAVGCYMVSNNLRIWKRPFMALRAYLLGSTGLMNSVLAGNDSTDSKGTQSIKYASVVLNIRDQIYQYLALKPPSEQYVVVLDPGHGGFNPTNGMYNMGAIGINNLYESEVVLDVALKTASILRSYGLTVNLTRTRERDTSTPYDLADRLALIDGMRPDVLISVHANAFTSSTANGAETFWRTSQSRWLATILHKTFVNQTQLFDRGVKQDTTLYIIQGQNYPSALIEMGFLTNPKDYSLLSTDTGRSLAAQAIAKALISFFGIDVRPLSR